ncbi:MAG: hypothetical protein HC812_19910 [Leptolyngbya sp. RL_3_1]|nr:hypothetical protein [Leptolyngbya sp. RL_3_1]
MGKPAQRLNAHYNGSYSIAGQSHGKTARFLPRPTSVLRRSPLFLASLALAACRRPLGQSGDRAAANAARPVASSTISPSSQSLSLTPACGDSAFPGSITPAQTPGPFYSPNSPQRQSLLEANTPGTKLTLTGQVLSPDCQPLANCLVDFGRPMTRATTITKAIAAGSPVYRQRGTLPPGNHCAGPLSRSHPAPACAGATGGRFW